MKIFSNLLVLPVKFYKYFISPYLISNCRYLPTCSDYFIESINLHGPYKGLQLGLKRILRCHPVKFLGGRDGFDPVPILKKRKK